MADKPSEKKAPAAPQDRRAKDVLRAILKDTPVVSLARGQMLYIIDDPPGPVTDPHKTPLMRLDMKNPRLFNLDVDKVSEEFCRHLLFSRQHGRIIFEKTKEKSYMGIDPNEPDFDTLKINPAESGETDYANHKYRGVALDLLNKPKEEVMKACRRVTDLGALKCLLVLEETNRNRPLLVQFLDDKVKAKEAEARKELADVTD